MNIQQIIFKFLPDKVFQKIGMSKQNMLSLIQSMLSLDFSESLKSVLCPVRIICGTKDYANKKASVSWAQKYHTHI